MVRGLGDEDDGIDRSGVDTHLRDEALGRIGAQVKRRDSANDHPTLAEADGLGGPLQGGLVAPCGQSLLDVIPLDRSGRHGEAGYTYVRENRVHLILSPAGLTSPRQPVHEASGQPRLLSRSNASQRALWLLTAGEASQSTNRPSSFAATIFDGGAGLPWVASTA